MPQPNRNHIWKKTHRPAVADTVDAPSTASESPGHEPGRRVVGTGSPDCWDALRAAIFVLVLAPAWLFGSIWAFRSGQPYAGFVLLFASGFAALSGLITASPSSFNRNWLWLWAAFGLGLFLLLGFGAVHAACAG